MPVLVEYTDICGRLGQEEDGLAGRESRERSTSTELGTAEEARAQALEVSISFFSFPTFFFFSFACFPWFSSLLLLFSSCRARSPKKRG